MRAGRDQEQPQPKREYPKQPPKCRAGKEMRSHGRAAYTNCAGALLLSCPWGSGHAMEKRLAVVQTAQVLGDDVGDAGNRLGGGAADVRQGDDVLALKQRVR